MGIIARQGSWNAVLTVVGMGLGFVNMFLLFPHLLSPEEFGLTRLVVSVAGVTASVAQLGMEATVIRYFPYFRNKEHAHNGLFGLVLLVGTCAGLLACVVLLLFQGNFSTWFNDRNGLYLAYGWVVAPLVLSEVHFILLRGISRAVHRSIAPAFTREFFLRALQTLFIAVYALHRFSFSLFMVLFTCTFVASTLLLLLDLRRSGALHLGLSRIRVPRLMRRSMTRYALFSLGTGAAALMIGNVDQLMIGVMMPDGLSYVAYYAIALYIGTAIALPARAMVLPMMPLLAEAWRKRDMPTISKLYQRSAAIQLALGAFVFLCVAVNLPGLFSLLPAGYETGAASLVLIALAYLISMATGANSAIIGTSRSYSFDAATSVSQLVLNVILDLVLIRAIGFTGAAWSTLISAAVILVARVLFLKRRYGLWPFSGETIRITVLAVAIGLLLFLLPPIGPPLWNVAARCTLITLLYWPAAHWLRVAPELGQQLRKVIRG